MTGVLHSRSPPHIQGRTLSDGLPAASMPTLSFSRAEQQPCRILQPLDPETEQARRSVGGTSDATGFRAPSVPGASYDLVKVVVSIAQPNGSSVTSISGPHVDETRFSLDRASYASWRPPERHLVRAPFPRSQAERGEVLVRARLEILGGTDRPHCGHGRCTGFASAVGGGRSAGPTAPSRIINPYIFPFCDG